MNKKQTAILALGNSLKANGYSFVAPTPATYARYLARARRHDAAPLVEAFGWNRPFEAHQLSGASRRLLEDAELLDVTAEGQMRSRIRFSSINGMLFAHSGFPTLEPDAVFFGPDTYRFARAISWLSDSYPDFTPQTIVDVGTGSGAGGIYAASLFPSASNIVLGDINAKALQLAEVNSELNGCAAQVRQSDVLKGIETSADLVISNPPYLIDAAQRAYRHGGGEWGGALAVRIVEEALGRLTDRGHLLLYTGTPIVAGVDTFLETVRPVLQQRVKRFRYVETDPDVFGEELECAPYDQADRIATVALHVTAADIRW
jgi:methylase of polypeptide subunit release factors